MPLFRVILTFADGRKQADIALRRSSAEDARWYVSHRAEEWSDKPTAVGLRRISEAEARAIVEDGGIDWAGV